MAEGERVRLPVDVPTLDRVCSRKIERRHRSPSQSEIPGRGSRGEVRGEKAKEGEPGASTELEGGLVQS